MKQEFHNLFLYLCNVYESTDQLLFILSIALSTFEETMQSVSDFELFQRSLHG